MEIKKEFAWNDEMHNLYNNAKESFENNPKSTVTQTFLATLCDASDYLTDIPSEVKLFIMAHHEVGESKTGPKNAIMSGGINTMLEVFDSLMDAMMQYSISVDQPDLFCEFCAKLSNHPAFKVGMTMGMIRPMGMPTLEDTEPNIPGLDALKKKVEASGGSLRVITDLSELANIVEGITKDTTGEDDTIPTPESNVVN